MRLRCLLLLAAVQVLLAQTSVGPARGALVVAGGGDVGPEITRRLIALAGGLDAPWVVIPTADGSDPARSDTAEKSFLRKAGVKNITVLHTTRRTVADSEAFVAPLRAARGVWFGGGRQWRLADSYMDTRTHDELLALLARGGVIGGSSAGASIQASYMVRGAVEGNQIMMAPGHERGLGFLRDVAVDQHLLKRKRENDMLAVVERHPALLGIGIDESTAIMVEGDRFEVTGESKVAIYEHGKPYYFLLPGEKFDMKARVRVK